MRARLRLIADALGGAPECDFPPPTVDDVLWAASIIHSRAFHLSRRDDDEDDEDEDDDDERDVSFDDDERGRFVRRRRIGDASFDSDPSSSSVSDDDTFEAFGGAPIDDDSYLNVALSVDDEDGSFLALVPWADALNHPPTRRVVDPLVGPDPRRRSTPRARRERPGGRSARQLRTSQNPRGSFRGLRVRARPRPDPREDPADIPGEWFWEEAEEAAAEEARDNDASNALKLLLLEEAAHGAPHRSALRSHLAAVGMRPEDTVLRVTPRGLGAARRPRGASRRRDPSGTLRRRLDRGEATDADEAWNVVSALMADESPAAIEREVRARGVLARLCSRLLRDYPSFAKYPSLAGGWGGVRGARRTRWRRAGWEKMEAVGVPPRETRRRRWCWRRRRGRQRSHRELRRIVTRPRVGEEASVTRRVVRCTQQLHPCVQSQSSKSAGGDRVEPIAVWNRASRSTSAKTAPRSAPASHSI